MKNHRYHPSKNPDAVDLIHFMEWIPSIYPRAIIVIAPGLTDHAERYIGFARYVNNNDIAVVAIDHLGQGRSGGKGAPVYFGTKDCFEYLLEDYVACAKRITDKYPAVPVVALGMSLGSYIVQSCLLKYPQVFDAAILIGTGEKSATEIRIAKLIAAFEEKIHGEQAAPSIIQSLALTSPNKYFKPNRTKLDWLIKYKEECDCFIRDPFRNKAVTVGAFRELMNLISFSCFPSSNYSDITLPILLCSGAEDPVGGFGKSVKLTKERLSKNNPSVSLKIYDDMRHDILHERKREIVYDDICRWIFDLLEMNEI